MDTIKYEKKSEYIEIGINVMIKTPLHAETKYYY